ncbi:GntR family transcriptional regulator [Paenibacillus psychroresistens]|uniref:GntR family transcriptional regulator n=1 Tax=Paenibacillus psychroresistens TaxID=1778678 RepID=A0A6B8RFM9_9BACL|nr:GntR family transcriptional regulator [Paenibacillus psychroresistens]QGQ94747.1 GntR family transcriptional regulator [Paenibacillus psychroresistens]
MHTIDKPALAVSPYLAIADILQKEIDNGQYLSGEPLPSEADLSRRFKVNRYTIRHSLDFMNKKGIIRSQQGKGHYVCEKPMDIQYTITQAMCFTDVMTQLGCKPSAKVLKSEVKPPPERIAKLLKMAPDEKGIRLEILRYADGIPLAWNETWLPEAYFPHFPEQTDAFTSLYALLREDYEVELARIWSTFEAIYPNSAEATHLKMSPSTTLLHIESVMRDQNQRLIEYTSAKYRGDLCRVSIQFEKS